MKKLIISLIVIALLGVIIGPRVIDFVNTETEEDEVQAISVTAAKAEAGDIVKTVEVIGNSYAKSTVPVFVTVPAVVESLNVSVGEQVNEDDELFVLSTEDIDSQAVQANLSLEQADAALGQAGVGVNSSQVSISTAQAAYDMALSSYQMNLSSYELAQSNLAKYEEMYKAGIVTEMEYEQMKLQASPETLVIYEKQLEQAQKALEQAKLGASQASAAYKQASVGVEMAQEGVNTVSDTLADMIITAPVSGYVTTVNVSEDVIASSAQAAIIIEDISEIKVTAALTSDLIRKIQLGDEVVVHFSMMDESFTGTISSVGQSANQVTLLYPIEVMVDNASELLRPGMFATVEIVDESATDAVLIPTDAIVIRDGVEVVYLVDSETSASMVAVEVGIDNGHETQILSGLKAGDEVISVGVGLIGETSVLNIIRGDE